jgi:hypothetical protein
MLCHRGTAVVDLTAGVLKYHLGVAALACTSNTHPWMSHAATPPVLTLRRACQGWRVCQPRCSGPCGGSCQPCQRLRLTQTPPSRPPQRPLPGQVGPCLGCPTCRRPQLAADTLGSPAMRDDKEKPRQCQPVAAFKHSRLPGSSQRPRTVNDNVCGIAVLSCTELYRSC